MRRLLLLAAVVLSFARCSLVSYEVKPVPTQHLIMINSLGEAVDPTGNKDCGTNEPAVLTGDAAVQFVQPPLDSSWDPCHGTFTRLKGSIRLGDEYDKYLDDLFAQMDAHYAGREGPRRVVVFFHGGLNNNKSTLERARDLSKQMMSEGYYPIFVNWQSALTVSLLEHIFVVRQGKWTPRTGWMTAGFYLGSDLARSVVRAPAVWYHHVGNEAEAVRQFYRARNHNSSLLPSGSTRADDSYERLRGLYEANCPNDADCKEIRVSRNDASITGWDATKSALAVTGSGYVPSRYYLEALNWSGSGLAWWWLPVKALGSPILDGLGGPAWDNFIRHYKLAYQNSGERGPDATQIEPEGSGAASELFRRLQEQVKKPGEWEITLIGHSMGAFLVNETVQRFPDLEFKRVVYMASACTIDEYEKAAYPYLDKHKNTTWHHLTLHSLAERRESASFFAPRGSLLMWIDTFFAKPPTRRDRTAGRYENLMLALEATPDDLRGRITAKTFGVDKNKRDVEPQSHGAFDDAQYRFWREGFWKPTPPP